MGKTLRVALYLVSGFVVLAAIALAALAVGIDRLEPQIVAWVAQNKDRRLVIDGELGVTLFPALELSLPAMRLSERGGEGEFARLERLRLRLALWPLLRREVVVEDVSVEGLHLVLRRHRDGSTNFDDLLPGEALSRLRFDIRDLKLRGAAVRFEDEVVGRRFEASHLEFHAERLRDGTPGRITARFALAVEPASAELTVRFATRLVFAAAERRLHLADVRLDAAGRALGVSDLVAQVSGDLEREGGSWQGRALAVVAQGRRAGTDFEVALRLPNLGFDGAKLALGSVDAVLGVTRDGRRLEASLAAAPFVLSRERDGEAWASDRLALGVAARMGATALAASLTGTLLAKNAAEYARLDDLTVRAEIAHPALRRGRLEFVANGDVVLDGRERSATIGLKARFAHSRLTARADARANTSPPLKFAVDIDTLDLDRLLKPQASARTGSPGPKLDLTAAAHLAACGTIRIARLTFGGVKVKNFRLGLGRRDTRCEPGCMAAAAREQRAKPCRTSRAA